MEEKRFGKNEVIFREGDRGNTFFEILEGNVGIYSNYEKKDQQKLTTLSAGQLFGEMGVIETWPRSSTAVAEDDVKAYEIGEDGLNAYFAEQPEMILAIMKHISGRIRSLTEEYTEVTNFLREAKSAGEQSDGFLAKMKKLLGSGRAAEKSMARPSAEWTREVRESWQKGSAPTMETYGRGTIVFKEGEKGNSMYAVHGGSVGIYTGYGTDKQEKLTTLLPGTFFGEMGMIDGEVRSATAVVEEDGTYVEIIRPEDLQKLFETNPVEVDQIMRHLSHRLRRLTEDYTKACQEVEELSKQ